MSIINFFRNRNTEDRYVLCFDGGGMRGVVSVKVLQKLEKLMREYGADRPIQTYFDLIAGTSTGGLIASALAVPSNIRRMIIDGDFQLDLKALEEVYMTMGRKIFPGGNKIRDIVNTSYQVISDKYPVSGIEGVLRSMYSDSRLGDANRPLLLMSYNLTQGRAEIISNYSNPDMSVVQACRATSAAPTFFPPLYYNGRLLADGGLIANNPSLYAYYEAKKLYPNCTKVHILSIGTGGEIHRTNSSETSGLVNWIDQLLPVCLTAQKDTVAYAMQNMPDVEYVRIDKEMESVVKMDDARDCVMRELNRFGTALSDDSEDKLKAFASKLVG